MIGPFIEPRKRLLEPMERIFEVLFGLIMLLKVTCSFSVAEASRREINAMLIAALGCNLAWGAIDAVFYLMARSSEQGQAILALALPPLLASALTPTEFGLMRQRLNQLPEPPTQSRLSKDDWLAALGVFLLVFLSTFPVAIPFLSAIDAKLALRISNGVAMSMLFVAGYAFGA